MKRLLVLCIVVWAWVFPSYAATDTVEVYFLPLHEAAEAVKTQLSKAGSVVEISSSRVLLIHDKTVYIKKAKALLKQLDKPVAQLAVQVEIEDSFITDAMSVSALSGGWGQLAVGQKLAYVAHRSQYQLRVSANKPGRIEVGSIHSFPPSTQRWLGAYGVLAEHSAEYMTISTGFFVQARVVGKSKVHVRITPWAMRLDDEADTNQAALIGLGKNVTPAIPDSYLRYNEQNKPKKNREVRIMGAATELTIPMGKDVMIAALNQEAQELANMLLAQHSSIGKRQLIIRLKVVR